MELVVKKLSNKATIPSRGSKLSAGYDLSAAYDIVVPARGKALVMTDLAVVIPDGCYGRIAPRSGFSWKKHTDIGAGVIDADYRGNIGIVVFNHGDNDISTCCSINFGKNCYCSSGRMFGRAAYNRAS